MVPTWIARPLSWLWPISVERSEGRFGPLEVRWENGRRVVNSAQGNQSFGSLHRVWQRTLGHVLSERRPANVLMLGFGGGSAAHILRYEMDIHAPVTAVELDPHMIQLARTHFSTGSLGNIDVVEGDATIRIHGMKERYDLILVDLFEDLDLARGVDSSGFIHALRDRCTVDGAVCFNTVAYDAASSARCQRVAQLLERVFHTVTEFRYEGVNRMFVAR